MIAKITNGNFTRGLINYHKNKVEKKKAEIFFSNFHLNDTNKFFQIESIFNSFNSLSKRKDKNFHVSLNFTKEDYNKLSEEQKKELIKDYMKGIGFPSVHPFISIKHFDKKHPHIHIIAPKILENGKVLNDSNIFVKSRKLSRELETKYKLSNAEKQNIKISDKNKFSYVKYRKLYDTLKISQKEYLTVTVKEYLKESKPVNQKEFIKGLNEIGIAVYFTKHKNIGIVYSAAHNNINTNSKDKGIKSSALSKELTFKNIENVFENNKKEKQLNVNFIASKINFIFYKYNTVSLDDFKKELLKNNIFVSYNYSGKNLSGVSFEYKNIKYKGQDLPERNYTFGKLKTHFSKANSINNNFIISSILYKNKLNKTENISFENYLDKIISLGIIPYVSKNGIQLSLNQNERQQSKTPILLNTDYNERIKGLSNELLEKLNLKIQKLSIEKTDKKTIPVYSNSALIAYINSLTKEDYQQFDDEEPDYFKKKKKKYYL